MRYLRRSLAMVALFVSATSVRAQVFYEPVQYQYGSGPAKMYYGGDDPRIFDLAARESVRDDLATSGNFSVARLPVMQSQRVYSDAVHQTNLSDTSYTSYHGFTPADARNEAYNNVPRYFRKRELLRAAVITQDGSFVVPAQAQPVLDIKVVRPFGVTTQPLGPKGTILIIPKDLLNKPLKAKAPSVAAAE